MPPHTLADAQAYDAADPLRDFRRRFWPTDPDLIYLAGNSLGRLPLATRDVLRRVIEDEWGQELVRGWTHWGDLARQAGDQIAALIGARPGEVIVCDSTTVNLYKLAAAVLDVAAPDRRVIVAAATEFPSDLYVLQGLRRRDGCQLRVIPTDLDAGVDPGQVADAVSEDTALVVISAVDYLSGAAADLPAITQLVHDAGAVMLWDLSHAAGAVHLDLDTARVDLAVGCTYKYLNAGPGAPAFLYVRGDLQAELQNPVQGWFAQRRQFDLDPEYAPVDSIARFLVSTPPIPTTYAAWEGARLLAEAGIARIAAKGQALTAYAVDLIDAWLTPYGVRLASPRDPARRGCHITLHHPAAGQLCQAAIDRGVIVDYRRPERIRLGLPPIYTSHTDVYRAVDRLHQILHTDTHRAYPAKRGWIT